MADPVSSVGLCVIVKTASPELYEKLAVFAPYVDKIYLQENGSPAGIKPPIGNLEYSTFKWNDNFADARNALLKEVQTDYWIWMDDDDDMAGVQDHLAETIEHMERNHVDIMFAPYHYLITDQGTQELQNRERIIRTGLPGSWHGAIHETFIPEVGATRETTDKLQWIHRKTKAEHEASSLRNRAILEHEYRKEPRDPRIAYYLGLNYGAAGLYEQAIKCFQELINTGGWDEERYRAYLQIFSCYFELKDYERAVDVALQATTELPEYPDAYFMLQQVYYELDDHVKALEWYKVGRSKPIPESDSAFSPVVRTYQPLNLAALSYAYTGEPKKAMQTLIELQKINPNYPINPGLKQEILKAVNEENAVEAAKTLIEFNKLYDGDPVKVLESLPKQLAASDVRLQGYRRELLPSKQWPKGSIVFYCGPSFEPWGPDTLEQGMGGSEEAITYLARELSSLGRSVTVYNERQQPTNDTTPTPSMKGKNVQSIRYLPWTEINPNGEFDTFIAWRSPAGISDIKARRKLVDMHDIIPAEDVYAAIPYVDKFCFKSSFHRELYPEVPDDKCTIIPNGIVTEQFA